MNFDLSYKEIYPKIFVYNNLLPNNNHICSILRKSLDSSNGYYHFGEWKDWYGFGRLCEPKQYDADNTDFTNPMYDHERSVEQQLQNVISSAFSHYVGINSVPIPPKSIISRVSFAAYYEGVETGNGNVMQYHTDYIVSQHFSRFENFLLTCTIYINDDYEGGEIRFTSLSGDLIDYKPQAGDVVVFPSGSPLFPGREPYFHAVKAVSKGTKFLIRSFVKYQQEGSKEWLLNEEIYGREKWMELEQERALSTAGRVSNQLQMINGVKHYSQYLVDAFGFDEEDKKKMGYEIGGFYE